MEVSDCTLRDILVSAFEGGNIPLAIDDLKLGDFEQWDSVGNFNLLLLVEERLNVRFGVDEITEINSVQHLKAALLQK